MKILLNIMIILIILIFSFIAVAAEIALLQTKKNDINPNDKFLYKMATNKSEFLSRIQVAITLGSVFLGFSGEPAMTKLLNFIPLPEKILSIISFILITYISIVVSELLPKNVAMYFTKETLNFVAKPIQFIHFAFYPMVWLLDNSSKFLSKIFNIPIVNEQEEIYNQEQLIRIIEESSKSKNSNLSELDYEISKYAFKLDNIKVGQIQKSTNDLSLNNNKYSRIPDFKNMIYSYKGKEFKLHYISNDLNLHQAILEMNKNHTSIMAIKDGNNITGFITNTDIYQYLFGYKLEDEKDLL